MYPNRRKTITIHCKHGTQNIKAGDMHILRHSATRPFKGAQHCMRGEGPQLARNRNNATHNSEYNVAQAEENLWLLAG